MKKTLALIMTFAAVLQLQAQTQDSLLAVLNQVYEEQVAFTLDTMFNGEDTIYIEVDTNLYFATREMIHEEIDTLAYKLSPASESFVELNLNGDEIPDILAVVYPAYKYSGNPLHPKKPQQLVLAYGNEKGSYDIEFMKAILSCPTCGQSGGTPDISFIERENGIIEVVEVREENGFICNDEYQTSFENGKWNVSQHNHTKYHMGTENLLTESIDRTKMMQVNEFETDAGEITKFRIAISPALRAKGIIVDGKLDEDAWNREDKWASRPCHATIQGDKHTRNDLFAKYGWSWDKNNLYLSLRVMDEKLVPLTVDNDELKGDYVQVHLDFTDDRLSTGQLREHSVNRLSIAVGFGKDGSTSMYLMSEGEVELSKTEALFERTGNGYNLEMGISKSDIRKILGKKVGKLAFRNGKSIGFAIEVADSDNRTTSEIENVDASARIPNNEAYKYGRLEMFDKYRPRTFTEIRRTLK